MIITVLGMRPYSFNDDKTGRLIEGINVWYVTDQKNEDEIGLVPKKLNLSNMKLVDKFKGFQFPCNVETVTGESLGYNGAIKSGVVDLDFIKKVNL